MQHPCMQNCVPSGQGTVESCWLNWTTESQAEHWWASGQVQSPGSRTAPESAHRHVLLWHSRGWTPGIEALVGVALSFQSEGLAHQQFGVVARRVVAGPDHATIPEGAENRRVEGGPQASHGSPFLATTDATSPRGLPCTSSLHAARTVEPGDRAGLERLARYCLRAPYSLDRLSLTPDGLVRYKLYRPWPTPTGRSEIIIQPLDFMKRLAALMPAPYSNTIRYHGVFANRSKYRPLLPPPPVLAQASPSALTMETGQSPIAPPVTDPSDTGKGAQPTASPSSTPPSERRPRRLSWASLMKRVLDVDALSCPKCHVPMIVLAFLTDPDVIYKILKHL